MISVHFDSPEAIKLLKRVLDKLEQIMATLEDLQARVTANGEVIASAITLIEGIAQRLRDAADDPEQIAALAAELDAQKGRLSEAIVANTPAEG